MNEPDHLYYGKGTKFIHLCELQKYFEIWIDKQKRTRKYVMLLKLNNKLDAKSWIKWGPDLSSGILQVWCIESFNNAQEMKRYWFTLGFNSNLTFLLIYLDTMGHFQTFFQECTFRRKWVFNELFNFEVPISFLRGK